MSKGGGLYGAAHEREKYGSRGLVRRATLAGNAM
jgi:hypothetical protein